MAHVQQKHACTRCRIAKLRCLRDTLQDHGKCRRCHDANVECIFDSIAPRQRRKRTDTRVAVLEKQIEDMKAAIDSNRSTQSTNFGNERAVRHEHGYDDHTRDKRYGYGRSTERQSRPSQNTSGAGFSETGERKIPEEERSGPNDETIPGLVTSSLLPVDVAVNLLAEFVCHVLPEYPILAVTDREDFSSLRTAKPRLLLAMITAASRAADPYLFAKLHPRLIGTLAEEIVVCGHRSLELVQALLIMEVWYDPPDDMRRLNFYLWIQIAGTMIRQLGLWPVSGISSPARTHVPTEPDDRAIMELRTAFAVYLSMSNVAISLRRPMTMTLTKGALEWLELFDQSSMCINDKRLVAWIRLQAIAEDVEALRVKLLKCNEEPTFHDSKSVHQDLVQKLEDRLGAWRYAAQALINFSLRVHFFHCRNKLYELAISVHHNQGTSLTTLSLQNETLLPTHKNKATVDPAYIRVVMSLIQSSHSVLDALLQIETSTYLRCPTVTTIRALYALQEIWTLWRSVKCQQTHLLEFITEEVLSPKLYARQIRDFFAAMSGPEGYQIPNMALNVLSNITNHVLLPERTDQRQTQQVPVPQLSCGIVKEASGAPNNDLEVILMTGMTDSEPSERSLAPVEVQNADSTTSDRATRNVTPSGTSLAIHNGSNDTNNEASILSEFDLMVMPDAAIDPSWLFSSEDYDFGQYRFG